MPLDADVLGFGNPWYPAVLATSWQMASPDGPTVRVASAPAFLAAKWAAFQDRGSGTDWAGSHDVEDILTVLDTRSEAIGEVGRAPAEVRTALSTAAASLVADPSFLNVMPGLVEPGRDAVVLGRLRAIAALD